MAKQWVWNSPVRDSDFRSQIRMVRISVLIFLKRYVVRIHRYVGDFMMVTDSRCWWQNHSVGDFFRYVCDFRYTLNQSPTSKTCHQHIWSPTSVTNIDVTPDFGQSLIVWTVYNSWNWKVDFATSMILLMSLTSCGFYRHVNSVTNILNLTPA